MNNKKLSVVTGGNKGIGKAIALRLAKENHDVIIFGRNDASLKSVQKEIKNIGVQFRCILQLNMHC